LSGYLFSHAIILFPRLTASSKLSAPEVHALCHTRHSIYTFFSILSPKKLSPSIVLCDKVRKNTLLTTTSSRDPKNHQKKAQKYLWKLNFLKWQQSKHKNQQGCKRWTTGFIQSTFCTTSNKQRYTFFAEKFSKLQILCRHFNKNAAMIVSSHVIHPKHVIFQDKIKNKFGLYSKTQTRMKSC
jgi:hypothetical protein